MKTPQPCAWPWVFPRRKVVLEEENLTCDIRVTDLSEGQYVSNTYKSSTEAKKATSVKPSATVKLRIISICSKSTVSPLSITGSLLEQLFQQYQIDSDFADVVASFGQDPNIAEGSSSNATIRWGQSQHHILSYQIRYVEQNKRGGQDPWSLRHTGLHHQKNINGPDVFVILHPVREPSIHALIFALEEDEVKRRRLCANPCVLHTWFFNHFFGNWRWYFRYLGERFSEENDLAMVVKPERAEPKESFRRVQNLRNTIDLTLSSRACCAGNLDLLSRLRGSQIPGLEELEAIESKMKGYIESADVLKWKIQNTIDLVGYTLTLHHQLEAAKIDTELRDLTEGLKRLTEDTVDDSTTVKIITFVSAVYLPGSFIASMFGMNFFLFNSDSKKIEISPDFWIFIATWLPLTLITGAIYMLILYIDSRLKGKLYRWPWQMKAKPPPTNVFVADKSG